MRLQKVTMIEPDNKDYTNDEKNGQRYTTELSGRIPLLRAETKWGKFGGSNSLKVFRIVELTGKLGGETLNIGIPQKIPNK